MGIRVSWWRRRASAQASMSPLVSLRTEAQADYPAGDLLRQLQSCDHVTGLALVAGGAGGDADALAAQVIDNILAGPAYERDGEDMGRAAGSGEDFQVGDG